jgi:hypothetical protein
MFFVFTFGTFVQIFFSYIFIFLKKSNTNIDLKNVLTEHVEEKKAESDAKTSKTCFFFVFLLLLCLSFFKLFQKWGKTLGSNS